MVDKKRIEFAVNEILLAIGEDVTREGLIDTPKRVSEMCEELFTGMSDDPKRYLKTFRAEHNGDVVVIKDIPVRSICEHHLLPFVGKANIAYTPKGKDVLGLSKFARIVDCFCRRPQMQERLTSQIADFITSNVDVYGVAVLVRAEHLCMTIRGSNSLGSYTETLALRGNMESNDRCRSEVMSILTKD